eukprot:7174537-Pyramimonas_sp.AAC.1
MSSPLPLPLPWVWERGGVRGVSPEDGPMWRQEGLGRRKMASKMVQDAASWLKIASYIHRRRPMTAPR